MTVCRRQKQLVMKCVCEGSWVWRLKWELVSMVVFAVDPFEGATDVRRLRL